MTVMAEYLPMWSDPLCSSLLLPDVTRFSGANEPAAGRRRPAGRETIHTAEPSIGKIEGFAEPP
jgi:hypothetical protein